MSYGNELTGIPLSSDVNGENNSRDGNRCLVVAERMMALETTQTLLSLDEK